MTLAQDMSAKAEQVAAFLKGLANSDRLLVLCELADGERCVTQLMARTKIAQTSMSQHLSKLRDEGIVTYRREHRTLYYSIADPAVLDIMRVLYGRFCAPDES